VKVGRRYNLYCIWRLPLQRKPLEYPHIHVPYISRN